MSTRQATFGDLAGAATRHLESLPAPVLQRPNAPRRGDAAEIAASVRAVLRPMTGYAADVNTALAAVPPRQRPGHAPWIRAASRVSEALANATAYLQPGPGQEQADQERPPSRTAETLRRAAASMTTGRDLLHTHAVSRDDVTQRARSEWAPVIASVPLSRALLYQVAEWLGRTAPHAGQAALTHLSGTPAQRQSLNAACQWLWVAQWAVEAAHDQQPVPAADLDLLHAIPACPLARRLVPAGGEPVTALCDAITTVAERARVAARAASGRVAWSPELTSESMRHAASHCAVTSWNCHLILRTLAGQESCPSDLTIRLRNGADAADIARAAWVSAAQAWDTILTDTRGGPSRAAIAAEDLALWTGRLAYAGPGWTPALGPDSPPRQPAALASTPEEMYRAIAAVHHACHTLDYLAASGSEQVRIATAHGRLVVPARNLPASISLPYPFVPAPSSEAAQLADAYSRAQAASERAKDAAAEIASAVRAPSRVLTTAQAVTRNLRRDHEPHAPGPVGRPPSRPPLPGPAKQTLLDLGVTSGPDLGLAAALDHATTQLILRAAASPGHQPPELATRAGSSDLLRHLLASGHGPALLRGPHQPSHGPASGRFQSRILIQAELAASPLAARQARHHLRQVLTEHGLSELTEHLGLLASELVANAAEHADGTTIGLVLRHHANPGGQDTITCEVSDHSATLPSPRSAQPGDERGRGLAIVAALAADSGARAGPDGKTCWFTLTTPAPQAAAARAGPEPEAEPGA